MGKGSEKITATAAADHEGLRLDVFLTAISQNLSRSAIKRLVDAGSIRVNGKIVKLSYALRVGDVVEAEVGSPPPMNLEPIPLNLSIIFEDDHLIVINKPSGLSVHPGAGLPVATLVHGLLAHTAELSAGGGDGFRPGIVHRLDKDTSGLLVVAKSDVVHAGLAQQFKEKSNRREYLALLWGVMDRAEICVESYLTRDPEHRTKFLSIPVAEAMAKSEEGKVPQAYRWAKSTFFKEAAFGQALTLARVQLFTGRTHQIRAHASSLGRFVVGDPLYCQARQLPHHFSPELRKAILACSRQLLHAARLGFNHPITKENLDFQVPVPADFAHILEQLAPYRET